MEVKYAQVFFIFAFCAALAPSLAAQDAPTHPRIISVTGSFEIEVPPDEVILVLGVDSHDKDLAVAKAENDRRTKRLLALATADDLDPKNIKTSALSLGPEYSDERIPKLLGYQVSQTVTLTLKDLSKYENLMTSALKAGVNRVDGINFNVAHPEKYKEEARLKAIQAARDKAVAMAGQLGQTIGKPWEVTEEPDIYSRDKMTSPVNGRFAVLPAQLEIPTVAGGEVVIRADVRVSFQLE